MNEALNQHELVKMKFIDFKENQQKKKLTEDISKRADCTTIGIIGHMAIFYRPNKDPKKRKIITSRNMLLRDFQLIKKQLPVHLLDDKPIPRIDAASGVQVIPLEKRSEGDIMPSGNG